MPLAFLHKRKKAKADLTSGCIWKTIIAFSLPIFFSYVLQNAYGLADAAICGQTLSVYEVAGVNDTGSIGFLFLQFAFGCTAGMSAIMSENIGRNDEHMIKKSFATQIRLSAFICIVLTTVGLLTLKPLLALIGIAPSDAESNNILYKAASTYMTVVIAGMVSQYFYNFICNTLRSLGDSFTPLMFLLISCVINIGLDLLFIMAFGWGVAGAAGATLAAQFLSAALCFIYALKKYPVLRVKLSDFKPDFKYDMKNLSQGIPLGLQFSILAFGLIALANGVVSFDKTPDGVIVPGAPAQNGNASAGKINSIITLAPNAIATAMLPFIAQNLGAKKYDRIKKGYLQAMLIMLILYVICMGIGFLLSINGAYQYVLLSPEKISEKSIKYGMLFLIMHLPMLIVLGTLVITRNSVQGLEKPIFPLLAGIAELGARIVVCLFLPQLVNGGPIDCNASDAAFLALCSADVLAWLSACLILVPAMIYNIRKLVKLGKAQSASEQTDAVPTVDADAEAEAAAVEAEAEAAAVEAENATKTGPAQPFADEIDGQTPSAAENI